MLKGIKITTDGLIEAVEIEGANHVTGINEAIGSRFYDVVSISTGLDVFIDDEGLFTSTLNPVLTQIAQANGYAGRLYGAGVFFGVIEESGETISLTSQQLAYLATAWHQATSYRHTPVAEASALLAH